MTKWALLSLLLVSSVYAKDDGRYANSPNKQWFNSLRSAHGLCCSLADGRSVEDPEWGQEEVCEGEKCEIRYWVIVDGQKLIVPPDAVVGEPNIIGPAFVWPVYSPYESGATPPKITIRCFLPGALS